MSLLFCPECNKMVSEHAETCPDCGFPIQKFMIDNNITDITKAFVCPKCADNYYWDDVPLKLRCEYCNTILVQTDMSMKELRHFVFNNQGEKHYSKAIELAKKFGNNQFDENTYNNRLMKESRDVEKSRQEIDKEWEQKRCKDTNTPKCPKCGSTAISLVSDVRGRSLVWTKMINCCANCGYKWTPGKKHLSWF